MEMAQANESNKDHDQEGTSATGDNLDEREDSDDNQDNLEEGWQTVSRKKRGQGKKVQARQGQQQNKDGGQQPQSNIKDEQEDAGEEAEWQTTNRKSRGKKNKQEVLDEEGSIQFSTPKGVSLTMPSSSNRGPVEEALSKLLATTDSEFSPPHPQGSFFRKLIEEKRKHYEKEKGNKDSSLTDEDIQLNTQLEHSPHNDDTILWEGVKFDLSARKRQGQRVMKDSHGDG